jgi:hypothetical protein
MTPEIEIARLVRKALPELEIKLRQGKTGSRIRARHKKSGAEIVLSIGLAPGLVNPLQKRMLVDELVLDFKRGLLSKPVNKLSSGKKKGTV